MGSGHANVKLVYRYVVAGVDRRGSGSLKVAYPRGEDEVILEFLDHKQHT
jgi:hypothetical protein